MKVAEALSVQNFVGGKNFTEVVQKVFVGTPLQRLMDRLTTPAGDGNGRTQTAAPTPIAPPPAK